MVRLLQYVYFRMSEEAKRLHRRGPDNTRDLTTIFMATIDGMYLGAAFIVAMKTLDAPISAPYWRHLFPIGLTAFLLVSHHLAFAVEHRYRVIREDFSANPMPNL